jgi:bacillithiol biosynthesis deacetylase BshB1
MKLDILAFAAHPDDVELACSGTIAAHIAQGKKVGVVDLTQGQLGTRGSAEERLIEAKEAAKVMGIHARENLGMDDGFFVNDKPHQLKIIEMLRKYQPDVVLCNAQHDRHTDHGKGGDLVQDACFLSGLKKIETQHKGENQEAWRPKLILRYIQDYFIKPDVVVDITPYYDIKIKAIKAFKTQFFSQESKEPETPISVPHFFDVIEGRCLDMGRYAGVKYAEGFNVTRPIGVADITQLF